MHCTNTEEDNSPIWGPVSAKYAKKPFSFARNTLTVLIEVVIEVDSRHSRQTSVRKARPQCLLGIQMSRGGWGGGACGALLKSLDAARDAAHFIHFAPVTR